MTDNLAEVMPFGALGRDAVDAAFYDAILAGSAPPNAMETQEGWFIGFGLGVNSLRRRNDAAGDRRRRFPPGRAQSSHWALMEIGAWFFAGVCFGFTAALVVITLAAATIYLVITGPGPP